MLNRLLKFAALNFLTTLVATAAYAQHSLDELQTRYNTYLGSVVVAFDGNTATAYQYQGEVMGQLQKIPEANRDAAKAQLSAQVRLAPEALETAVVLMPLNARQPVFLERTKVFRLEDAEKLNPQAVAALAVPDSLKRKRVVGAREVPWEIASSPEYKAERAKRETEQAAFLTALFLMYRDSASSEGGDLPSCLTPVRNSEGREIVVPC